MNPFDRDISLTRISDDEFQAQISDQWQINVGPNGGYIAAIILNGLKQVVPNMQTRSITCHFLSASTPGPAKLKVDLRKAGRTLSTATAMLIQGDRTVAFGIATFANSRDTASLSELTMPRVPQPDEIPPSRRMGPDMLHYAAFRDQYDQRLAIGPTPPETADAAEVGGWTRFKEPRVFDDLGLLAISDSWFPSMHARIDASVHAPTVDHTVHFLTQLPIDAGDGFVLVNFKTQTVQDGYLVEDGFIWSASGTLLVRCRQLAIVLDKNQGNSD